MKKEMPVQIEQQLQSEITSADQSALAELITLLAEIDIDLKNEKKEQQMLEQKKDK